MLSFPCEESPVVADVCEDVEQACPTGRRTYLGKMFMISFAVPTEVGRTEALLWACVKILNTMCVLNLLHLFVASECSESVVHARGRVVHWYASVN